MPAGGLRAYTDDLGLSGGPDTAGKFADTELGNLGEGVAPVHWLVVGMMRRQTSMTSTGRMPTRS